MDGIPHWLTLPTFKGKPPHHKAKMPSNALKAQRFDAHADSALTLRHAVC
ncbi:hypothetical protein HMPREF0004_5375 [Achromobacter piechaudii ATCC 43553]|uniref:Uncharacterized protein n=1 Tax=Achromobacter piechaudii ATCC 43553 TaxID=742159 RepID=D4XIS8_9BURK|nr:hypothetical protein HMPREF0004_5375 [Achromobacter piechaudii ATCC 43553]